MSNFFKTTLAVITGMIAIGLQQYFVAQSLSIPLSIALSVVVTVVCVQIFDYAVTDFFLRVYWFRLIADPRAAIEGIWLEEGDSIETTPYGLVTIFYNRYLKSYIVEGFVFNEKLKVMEVFKSEQINIRPDYNQIMYTYRARKLDADSDTFGITMTDFTKKGLSYISSRGQYMDSGTKYSRSTFSQRRLLTSEVKDLIGKNTISSRQDAEKLVTQYHKSKSLSSG
jgi:hypothetical protein